MQSVHHQITNGVLNCVTNSLETVRDGTQTFIYAKFTMHPLTYEPDSFFLDKHVGILLIMGGSKT